MECDEKPEISLRAARTMAIDMAAFGVLMLFALLSLGPVGGLFRGGGVQKTIVNGAFLATSLWGLLLGFAVVRWLMSSEYRGRAFEINRRQAAAYGLIWCCAYLIYVQVLA
jgi:hypothetical protein